ncbi:MAG: sulfotransferase domain-containing protein [Candidatus Brocadiaceae bacterium]|nr:sulfotransferase domain-containing protein [Candidatus Brocadiaceae bacterium]
MIRKSLKKIFYKKKVQKLKQSFLNISDHGLVLSFPQIATFVNKLKPLKQPPVLLVSIPRGGSSWIGSILGSSDSSLYLREPITQSYLNLITSGPSFFEFSVCKEKEAYCLFADNAFKGVPQFNKSIIEYPSQWDFLSRSSRRLVIKEVNPLAISFLIEKYNPKIIYILRHPVPVANSFHVLGWTGEQFKSRFSRQSLMSLEQKFSINYNGDFWEQSGALQAIIQNIVMDVLRSSPNFLAIEYEQICTSPLESFTKLFEFCELNLGDEVKEIIKKTSSATADYSIGKYDTFRNSKEMINKWRGVVKREDVEKIRKGYFANKPHFYYNEEDW